MTIAEQPPHPIESGADAAHGVLDVADGLKRVMGDHALYQRMLRRFCSDYPEGVAPIRRAIAGGDLPLAHRIAHTLKGASGMISATAVHRQASLLEAALRDACTTRSDLLDTLDQALAAMAPVMGHLLLAQTPPDSGPSDAPAPQPVQALLVAQLADFLDRGDSAALPLLEQSEGSLRAALGGKGFDAVARAAREFDFEGALAALNRMKEKVAGN